MRDIAPIGEKRVILCAKKGESPLQTPEQTRIEFIAGLKELIIRVLRLEDIEPKDIIDSDPLFGDGLGLDSIDALELVVAIEKEYCVEIPDAEVGRHAFASMNALADFILEKETIKKTSDALG